MEKEFTKEQYSNDKVTFGFWVYLMTDLLMFAVLFATYSVLRGSSFGGPTEKEIFSLPGVLMETLILLTSSFTSGLGMLAVHKNSKQQTFLWFGITFLLGLSFLGIELSEFKGLISEGHTPQRSAFLSAFFTLVGTHGLHISFGLLWMAIIMVALFLKGLTKSIARKLILLSLFWHFLDIVWIFIFTIVYLMGAK
jgi:cytochrome o ubiquinol oxidase subunit III